MNERIIHKLGRRSAYKSAEVIVVVTLIAMLGSGCRSSGSPSGTARTSASGLSDDEKHRLYSAALAASDSPLDSELFRQVCRRIEIFEADDKPNDHYLPFVRRHIEWATGTESEEFRREINSREKAREYIKLHLPGE